MSAIKRILFLVGLGFVYLIFKELVSLFVRLDAISPILGYAFIAVSTSVLIYFGILPVLSIYKMSVYYPPVKDKNKIEELRGKRIELFKKNKYLLAKGIKAEEIKNTQEDYDNISNQLSIECALIRKKYVNALFYSTSISQNGFIDASLILSYSTRIIKEIFELYNGRANNFVLILIAKKVYGSILIGGSEGVEYVTHEMFTKMASDTISKIPFIDKITTSLADGFINASLLTRVSLITENYCKMLYIETEKDLYPSAKFIATTSKDLTSELLKKVNENLLVIAKDKAVDFSKRIGNPVMLVFDKTSELISNVSNEKDGNFLTKWLKKK